MTLQQPPVDSLQEALAALACRLPGRLGVCIRYLPDGPEVCYQADELFPAASVIKIPIMVEVYRQATAGSLSLDEPLPVLAEEVADGSGLLQYLHTGLDLSVADAVELMIAISDNTATNLLLRRLGVDAVNDSMPRLGLVETTVGGPIRVANADLPLNQRSRTTPREIALLLAGIAQGTLIGEAASAAMRRHLEHQLYNDMLPRHLPIILYPERVGLERTPVGVAHKTGGHSGVRHDAGIITAHDDAGARTVVVSAFTADLDDGEIWTAENVGARAVAEIGRLTYETLLRIPATAPDADSPPSADGEEGAPARPARAAGFDAAYAGTPPWDIGRPQPAFLRLAEAGAIRGRVLDVGCGTGEHALLAAGLGLAATGIDAAPTAIERALGKARDRRLDARFLVWDAFDLLGLGAQFDTVLDCGLFHVFDDEERPRFVECLRAAIAPGGRYYMLCFSEREPGDWGPRRVRQEEIRASFAAGWHVESIEGATLDITINPAGALAWLSTITRL